MINLLFSFRGRIGRLAWWSTNFLNLSLMVLAAFAAVHVTDDALLEAEMLDPIAISFIVPMYLLSIWSSLATTAKRYHDRNKSGLWCLIPLIPFGITLLVIECGFFSGTYGPNAYGSRHEQMSEADLIQSVLEGDGVRPDVQTRVKQREEGRQGVKINQPAGAGFGRRTNSPYAT